MTVVARQVATVDGYPCVTCGQEPCRCIRSISAADPVQPAGALGATRRRGSLLRRYRFPDGSLYRLSEEHAAQAVAAGAVPVDAPEPR